MSQKDSSERSRGESASNPRSQKAESARHWISKSSETSSKALKNADIIEPTHRGPFIARSFLVPKHETETRLIIDYSAITDQLPCPKFYLSLVFQLIQRRDFADLFPIKLDFKDAFFHIPIHKNSRYVNTFKLDNVYHRFRFLPFGLSVAPFYMQMFCNTITSRFTEFNCLAWGHVDDILVGHKDLIVLQRLLDAILQHLFECQVRINFKNSIFEPTRTLNALVAIFDTISNEVTLTETRKLLIGNIFDLLLASEHMSTNMLQRSVKPALLGWRT